VTAIGVGQNPSRDSNGRHVAMASPTGGEHFTAPASLRLVAAAHDPNVYNNTPTDGHGGNAASVQFFVDDTMVRVRGTASARGRHCGVRLPLERRDERERQAHQSTFGRILSSPEV
jgi:hypothetical protein